MLINDARYHVRDLSLGGINLAFPPPQLQMGERITCKLVLPMAIGERVIDLFGVLVRVTDIDAAIHLELHNQNALMSIRHYVMKQKRKRV